MLSNSRCENFARRWVHIGGVFAPLGDIKHDRTVCADPDDSGTGTGTYDAGRTRNRGGKGRRDGRTEGGDRGSALAGDMHE